MIVTPRISDECAVKVIGIDPRQAEFSCMGLSQQRYMRRHRDPTISDAQDGLLALMGTELEPGLIMLFISTLL